jgi:hypothetical protein
MYDASRRSSGVRRCIEHRRTPDHANHKEVAMAERNHTREQSRLEQTIEAERSKLLQANAVLRCLYEVLLYADGEDAIQYAEAAHVVSTLIDDSVARLDLVRLRPQIEELKRGSRPDDGTMLRDSATELYRLEDTCRIRIT